MNPPPLSSFSSVSVACAGTACGAGRELRKPTVCCTSVSFAMRVLLTKTAKSQFVSKNSDVSPATAGRLQEIDQFLEAALHSKLACVKANG
jgi:hypothetical protein